MYIVPQRAPALSAANNPRSAWPAGACVEEASASITAPTNITKAPPSTPTQRRNPAFRSSLKSSDPQIIPSRLLELHSGNAMLRPISRIANTVRVLATAHMHPAIAAQMTKCGALRPSSLTPAVPWISAGSDQRARNTPETMTSETSTGDRPTVTNLVGASAAPSQAPAANPQRIPSAWSCLTRVLLWLREAAEATEEATI